MAEIIAENVDRACTVEMRPGSGMPRGTIHQLYQAAREKQGGSPTLLAAQQLQERVKQGDVVLILTGAADDTILLRGETDGPLGAAALGHAIEIGLGAKPVFITEHAFLDVQRATCQVLGFMGVDDWDLARRRPFSTYLVGLEVEDGAAEEQAQRLFEQMEPKAVVAVEKLGPNRKGVYHSVRGVDFSHVQGKAHHIFDLARDQGCLTIGIGDGGNELGFGLIFEEVRSTTPYGARCQCSCQDGAATRVGADVLVPAAVSNWGAYGVAAVLAFLLRNPDVLHTPEDEGRMLVECVRAGGGDGLFGRPILYVDGIPAATQVAVVTYLRTIVDIGLTSVHRQF